MKNYEYLAKNKEIYLKDDDAVFKFKDVQCFVKFKGEKEYEIETSGNLAMFALLGGDMITKQKYIDW